MAQAEKMTLRQECLTEHLEGASSVAVVEKIFGKGLEMKSEITGERVQILKDFGSYSDETRSHQRIWGKEVTGIGQKFKRDHSSFCVENCMKQGGKTGSR